MKRHKLAWLLAAGVASLMAVACGGNDPDYVGSGLTPGFVPGAGIAPPRFAYVVHSNGDNVSGYSVNETTGVLTLIGLGSPWVTGSTPKSIAVDPLVRYAYVANSGSGGSAPNSISVFSIADPSGALTAVGPAPVPTNGTRPVSVAVDPQGRYVYAANAGSDTITAFTRGSGGGLTLIGSPFSVGVADSEPSSVVVDPAGKFVYVANSGSGTVTVFSIDSATTGSHTPGALTYVESKIALMSGAASAYPNCLTISPAGTSLYVTNETGDSVVTYRINPTTGSLTYVTTAPDSGSTPTAVAVEPNGRYAYVSKRSFGTISAYSIATGGGLVGTLTPLAGAAASTTITTPPNPGPTFIAADPSGTFVYAPHLNGGAVSAYKINVTTGALTPVAGTPFDGEIGVTQSDFILITK